ncbi:hypothetical protein HDU99_008630 [Rhizoclosmatium hyalinum]|nr:hypothetical protein HDU99_008630 [Rhizoclosmatium hyalinum]
MPTSLAAKIAGSIAGSPSNENMRRRASQQQIERIMGLVSDNPEVTPIFDDGPVGSGGVTIRAGSPTRRTQSNPSSTGQTVVSIQGGTLPNDFDDETDLDGALMGVTSGALRVNPHLEPPAFRVPGILDAPFSSGAIPKGDEQKLLLGDGGLSGGTDEGSEASRSSVATAGVVRDVVDPNKEDLQNYS